MTSNFTFQTKKSEVIHEDVNITKSDALFNLTTSETQLMNGNVPWRGPREKSPLFVQALIEQLTKPGDIVLDWKAGTGNRSLNRSALPFFSLSQLSLTSSLCFKFQGLPLRPARRLVAMFWRLRMTNPSTTPF